MLETYVEAGCQASDTHDGNLTSQVLTANYFDNRVVGTGNVTYTVSDAAGNKASKEMAKSL